MYQIKINRKDGQDEVNMSEVYGCFRDANITFDPDERGGGLLPPPENPECVFVAFNQIGSALTELHNLGYTTEEDDEDDEIDETFDETAQCYTTEEDDEDDEKEVC
jgi:hypothetical protein